MRGLTALLLLVAVGVRGLLIAVGAGADPSHDCDVHAVALDPTETSLVGDWVSLTSGLATSGGVFTDADDFLVPQDIVVWGLRVDVENPPGANPPLGHNWTVFLADGAVTLLDLSTNVLLSCTIAGSTDTSCTSLDRITVAAGSSLALWNLGSVDVPDASSEMRISFCMDYE